MQYWDVYIFPGDLDVQRIDPLGRGKDIQGFNKYTFPASKFSAGVDPSFYRVINSQLVVLSNGEVTTTNHAKTEALDKKKNETDKLIREKQRTLYTYKDHVYYPDERLMNAIATAHPFRPDDHTLDVKTAEKLPDGANNVWVTLNKAELAELSMGFLQRQADIWEYGSRTLKGKLNDIFTDTKKTVKDIRNFDIKTGWPV
jgi:hypothetical protein